MPTKTASLNVVKPASAQIEDVEPTEIEPTEPEAEPTVLGKRKDTRQPIQVEAPAGYVKGAAVVYHFAESVPADVQSGILDAIETACLTAVEAAGLQVAASLKTYHSIIRIGSESDLAKPVKAVSRKRDEPKVLTVETAKKFLNASEKLTSELIKSGQFDKVNRKAAQREAIRLTLLDWNITKEQAIPILADYQASLLG